MPSGGRLTISSAFNPREGGVEIQVRDTGCGISKQDIPLIFEPFFTTKTKGKGVGPSTVFGIIDRHKGTIHVESGLGKGAAFTVKLPVETKLSKSEATRSPSHSSFQDRRTQIPSPATDPQHAVSPGPGIPFLAEPEREEGAESILFRFRLPQEVH